MSNKPVPKEPEAVACNVCLDEIPGSVSSSQEADEYTQHFCGIECYSVWKEKKDADTGADNSDTDKA